MSITPDVQGPKFKPLSTDFYSIPKAQIFFRDEGAAAYVLLGDADNVTVEAKPDLLDRYTNETGIRTLTRSFVTLVTVEANMTLLQLTDTNRAMALLGNLTYDAQLAVVGHVQTITAAQFDEKIYPLDHKQVDAATVVVTDDAIAPVTYVLNVDYKIDAAAGYIQILQKHAGATANVVITYNANAVTANDKVARIGVGGRSDFRGSLIIRGTNALGPRLELNLPLCQLHPTKPRNFISEKDLTNIDINVRVFRDDTQAAGFEFGYERKII